MEQLIYKKIIGFLLCSLLAISVWAGGKEKFEKHFSEEFPITADGKVHLLNKYGNVNVVTGNSNTVQIDIKVIVNASNQAAADETFERINIEFNKSADYVSAVTTIGDAKKSSWFGWTSNNSGDFQIHYEVQMPRSNDLELHNKYGNTYVDKLDGQALIEVKYGNLKMDDVRDKLDLTMGYGTGSVGNVDDLTMNVKYSTLDFESTGDVNAMTKYSKFTIERAGDIVATTKYDNYKLGQIGAFKNEGKYDHFTIQEASHIDTETKYTTYKINYLAHEADFDMEYGGATISKVGQQFSSINIDGRYTEY